MGSVRPHDGPSAAGAEKSPCFPYPTPPSVSSTSDDEPNRQFRTARRWIVASARRNDGGDTVEGRAAWLDDGRLELVGEMPILWGHMARLAA